MLLQVENLGVSYGPIQALRGISLEIEAGEIVTLIGANGAGKSTSLRAISGLVTPQSGKIIFQGQDITGWAPNRIVAAGLVHVPEGRRIFANLSVEENLELAGYLRRRRDPGGVKRDFERVFALFPRLKERRRQLAGTLSGGEQQMLAIGRALVTRGHLMLLDEPSMGLAPILVSEIFKVIREINREGTTILLVEQNAFQALRVAHRAYILQTGSIIRQGAAAELALSAEVKRAYLAG
ncbi:MAG TPA: ABC transporter ATP-binding protein [Firmicutes bacterium]|nr:ABC transporter ATP-binding protein [Bacillota bacterium]